MIDLSEIRYEQAKTLKADARNSAVTVSGIILYVSVLLLAGQYYSMMVIWLVTTLAMVGVTLLYARYVDRDGITPRTFQRYLRGHTLITFVTGLVWGTNALFVTDFDSLYSVFIAVTIATSITIGGMFPGNSYRPAYIALAVPTILVLALYITIFAPLPVRYFGIGLLLFFGFALLSSAKAEFATRDWIINRTRQKLADSVVAHNAEVKQVFDSKAQFLATASHDLSQPLHAQGHYIEALRKMDLSPEQSELVEKIALTWRTQKEMLSDLVALMRLDGGMVQPTFSKVDLSALLRDLVKQVSLEAKRQSLDIHADIPCGVSAESDPVFLRRIVSNALTNAMKHGGDIGKIRLNLIDKGDAVQIDVMDRGPGFHVDGNVLTAPMEVRRGGVGLTSIETISELVKARPFLSNRTDGPGSIFTLIVPKKRAPGDAPDEASALSASSVMVIDDDRTILDALSVLFTQWGVQILSADSVDEAVSVLGLTQMPIDLLIVDNRLGEGMDAPRAISAIRAATRDDLPAVVVSGDVYAPSTLAGLEAVTILPKPVDVRDFRRYFDR